MWYLLFMLHRQGKYIPSQVLMLCPSVLVITRRYISRNNLHQKIDVSLILGQTFWLWYLDSTHSSWCSLDYYGIGHDNMQGSGGEINLLCILYKQYYFNSHKPVYYNKLRPCTVSFYALSLAFIMQVVDHKEKIIKYSDSLNCRSGMNKISRLM